MKLTKKQHEMLVEADRCSLPGDGLRVAGPGAFTVAYLLKDKGGGAR